MFTKKILISLMSILMIIGSSSVFAAKTVDSGYSTIAYVEYNQLLIDISNASADEIEELLQTKKEEKIVVFTNKKTKRLEETMKEMEKKGYTFRFKKCDVKNLDIKVLNIVKHYLGNDFKVIEVIVNKKE